MCVMCVWGEVYVGVCGCVGGMYVCVGGGEGMCVCIQVFECY